MASSLSRAKLARAALVLNARQGRMGSPASALALMTDDTRLVDPLPAARALPRGSLVILRARDSARRATLAVSLLPVARQHGLLLLIADDPLLVARIGAHGLHLPQNRAKQALHWRARFPGWIITAAAHSLRAIGEAAGADAVFLSPVFATQSHEGTAPLSPARARLMARQVRVPLFALGGVTARNATALAGFAGIAAIGALITD